MSYAVACRRISWVADPSDETPVNTIHFFKVMKPPLMIRPRSDARTSSLPRTLWKQLAYVRNFVATDAPYYLRYLPSSTRRVLNFGQPGRTEHPIRLACGRRFTICSN